METKQNISSFAAQLNDLDQDGNTIVEYVWLGGSGMDLRSKAKTYNRRIEKIEELSEWYYDGSSTYQAQTDNSEILLKPVALFRDPFRKDPNKICFCETFNDQGKPTNTNFRYFAEKIFSKEKMEKHDPWFGLEQEYCLMKSYGVEMQWPYGWPVGQYPSPQGPYYCSVGAQNSYGREISDLHYKACLYAGVKIYGTNAEVMPGQWEFQIGTVSGIDIGDHMWMARYLLSRVGEFFNVDISYDPKPVKGNWNGSGCHTNFSTNETRNDKNLKDTNKIIEALKDVHYRSILLYGDKNEERLTGQHETSSMTTFSFGKGNRAASIRIPKRTEIDGKGYIEDRRPAANIDPYVICSSLFSFACLKGYGVEELEDHYGAFLKNKNKN